ncbi:MAG: hypothetical protein HYT31_04805 [Parcubacteria group bacterium]|nr:hypothetical protein [Parcubacteria group bacterium]
MTARRTLIVALLVSGLAGFAASPHPAFAQRSAAGENALNFLDATAEKGGLSSGIKNAGFSSEDAVLGIVGNIINVILGFVGIIFFVQMFYAGFRWMSSGGNEEVVTEARQTIKSAVIGIAVVFAAFVVTNFTLNQIASITGPTRPSGLPPEDESYDPSLDAPGGDLNFGELPPPLGTCIYPKSGECDAGNTGWTDLQSDVSENACMTLAASACGDPDLHDWY